MKNYVSVLMVFVLFGTLAASAATYTVTKVADTNDGTCDADCSLREAVAAAGATVDNDVIAFDAMVFGTPQTITLSGSEIVLGANGTLDINGPGANLLTISGNNASRLIVTGAGVVATISGARFTQGNGVGATNTGRGGAIYNNLGSLTLNNVVVTGNSAANGGGLNNAGTGSSLTLNNCIVSNNTSTSSGGGMQNFSTSTLTINNSTFSGNMGGSTTGGGGAQFNGTVRLTNSTFANNTATAGSGGGFQSNGTSLIMTNVTVYGNTAVTNGGGIHRATTNVNFFPRNSIIAGNVGDMASPDVTNSAGGITSEGNNIIGNVGTSTGWLMSDLLNTNPLLGMLGDNGGFGQTLLPMSGSPAIDAGQNCVVDLSCATNNPPAAVTTDQRGVTRPAGMTVDIGAVEVLTNATVSGRVLNQGSPVSRALVTMTVAMPLLGGPATFTAYTNSFGNFRINDVPTGSTYTINVLTNRYLICPQNVVVNGDVSGITLVTDGEFFGLRSMRQKSAAGGCPMVK